MEVERPTTGVRKPRRRWHQFSLRLLMLATTVAAVACWYVKSQIDVVKDEWREEAAAIEAIKRLVGTQTHRYPIEDIQTEKTGPAWLRCFVPDSESEIFDRVTVLELQDEQPSEERDATDDLIVQLRRLKHLRDLSLKTWSPLDQPTFEYAKLARTFPAAFKGVEYSE